MPPWMDLVRDYGWLVFVVLLVWWLLAARAGPANEYPYRKRKALMSANERCFYQALLEAAGHDFDVFSMVRLSDLLRVETGARKRQVWQNRINSKHIDFVLCDRNSQEVLLAIEVDDRSHRRQDRQERDYFVDRACEAAKLRLLRVEAAQDYCVDELRTAIRQSLKAKRDRRLPHERRVRVGKPA